ncbi:MAG: ABC transporter substrate-binding protein [Coriobacteriia bacterium]
MRAVNRQLRLLACVVLLAAVVTTSGCAKGASKAGTEPAKEEAKAPYKIGAILALSGTYAGLGTPEKNAIELEVAAINDAGGVDGHPLEVVYEDDANDPTKAVAAATRLIEQEKVIALLGTSGSGSSMAIRGTVDKAGVPQVSMAGGSVISDPLDKWVFQTPWPNRIVMPYILDYMKAKGIARVAIISDSGAWGKDAHDVAVKKAATVGVQIVADETFNPGDTDMTAQLTKLKASNAQAVWVLTSGAEAAIVVKNAEQLKIGLPLFGSHGNARKEFVKGAGTAAEGYTFAAGKVLVPEAYGQGTEGYDVAKDFINRYTTKYGEAPNTFAGHAYDALHITAAALEGLPEGATAADLRDRIEGTSGLVGIGGTFTFSATDHSGLTVKDIVMYTVKSGEWVLAQ